VELLACTLSPQGANDAAFSNEWLEWRAEWPFIRQKPPFIVSKPHSLTRHLQ
jgi:hypothetical protein